MSLAALEKRLRKLEIVFLRLRNGCTCRSGQETTYHTAGDLERIMNVGCPVHQFRDLGHLSWVPSGTPLLLEDRYLCECPPNPTRDLLGGKRGPLTQQEQEKECREWQREFTKEAQQDFRTQQATLAALIKAYQRRRHEALQR